MDWKPQAPLGYWWGTPRVQGAARGRQALQDAHATNSPVDVRRVGQHRRREQKLWWYAMLPPHGTGERTPTSPRRVMLLRDTGLCALPGLEEGFLGPHLPLAGLCAL